MDYYLRFIKRFPDLVSLAEANEEEVLKLWEGLGYYSRARNLFEAAKKIHFDLGGVFPESYTEMLELKGVGPYTAAAISSIAFGEPRAVVDGNVHRVLSRLFGIEEPPSGYGSSSMITRQAESLLDQEDPGTHNQAIMELGALVCKPRAPDCQACPLKKYCHAYLEDRINELPLRPARTVKRLRYFHYLLIFQEETLLLGRRQGMDIWKGLFQFPLIETMEAFTGELLVKSKEWTSLLGPDIRPSKISNPVKHLLSHQEIRARFYHIQESLQHNVKGYEKVKKSELQTYPLPKLIRNYLETFID